VIRFIDGKPEIVPDDERITPQVRELRSMMNGYLTWLFTGDHSMIERQFREGHLSRESGFDWYADVDVCPVPRCDRHLGAVRE